jgi:hypothetical protein
MKNLLIIFLILMLPLQTFAFEDYLILSDKPVSSITWSDDNILSAFPLLTIDNKKNSIVVRAKTEGFAILTIETDKSNANIEVKVTKDKTILSAVEGFTYFVLDKPEENWKK